MAPQVIVGAGPVGSATARLLAERGEQVRLITRSGGGPEHPAIERVAADATDAERLSSLATGATVLYNCAAPPYDRWLTDLPPLAAAIRTAAERSGAVLASANNLYGYEPVDGLITPETPFGTTPMHPKRQLRVDIWQEAHAAHEAGRLAATEVRSSDYIEANSIISIVLAGPLLAGKKARVPSALDVPHSWTSIADVAETLVTVATDERAWGRPWLVPTNPPLTLRELAARYAEVHEAPAPRLAAIPYPMLWTAGLLSSTARELRITRYQFAEPFVVDTSQTEQTFGLTPTGWDEALANVRTDR
jgi:nucleoside-diphosphate-sugar epimerase